MISKDNFLADQRAAGAAYRYELQRTAQGLLWDRNLEGWREQHRTCWCSRHLKNLTEKLKCYRNEARDGASLAGMNRCGNVWTCPVCAAKIAEPRRAELQAGMVAHVGNGGTAYLFNFTFPHDANEQLTELMEKFTKARHAFQNSREWKAFQDYAGNIQLRRKDKMVRTIGVVNSLEFTISQENGWHPHLHMLVFSKRRGLGDDEHIAPEDSDLYSKGDLASETVERLKSRWVRCCRKHGLGSDEALNDMLRRGLVVRGGEKAAEYIAKFGRDEKWGASSELARAHSKIGAAGERFGIQHYTPFQLLAWAEQRDGWAVARFREFAKAVEGKRALVWCPDLKRALGIKDQTDEELAEERPMQVLVGELNADQFSIIVRKRAVARFMEYLATCADTQEHLDEFIESIKELPDKGSGTLLVPRHFSGGKSVIYA